MAKTKHMAAIEAMRAERLRLWEAQRAAARDDEARADAADAFRASVVEEARRRLLREHATKLRAFLPKVSVAAAAPLGVLFLQQQLGGAAAAAMSLLLLLLLLCVLAASAPPLNRRSRAGRHHVRRGPGAA